MNKKQMKNQVITKSHSKIIDQRDLELPPSWIAHQENNDDSVIFNNHNQIFISGPDRALSYEVISLLNSAKEMVVICSFLLADQEIEDAINKTAERGVRIYLMLASEARLDKEPGDGEFDQRVIKQHKAMLKRLGGKVLIRSAPHFHAKVILADPNTTDAKGFLLTANFTKEAIERNEELGVELTSPEIKETVEYLRWAIWESSEHEMMDSSNFGSVKELNTVSFPEKANKYVYFTTPQSTDLKLKLLDVIRAAKTRIIITSFGWEKNHQVVKELCKRAKHGLDITVLARIRGAAMPALIELQQSGVKVFGFDWLHVKSIWTDKNEALVMSANIERHGLDTGFEIGVFLTDFRQKLVFEALKYWINKSQTLLQSKPKIGDINGQAIIWKDDRLKPITIAEEKTADLGAIKVNNEKFLDNEPNFPPQDWAKNPCHQIRYEWINTSPRTKAKKLTPKLVDKNT